MHNQSIGIVHRVTLVSLTQCNWQFICSVLSLWTSSPLAYIFITVATQFRERKAWTEVNERSHSLTIHLYACYKVHTCCVECVCVYSQACEEQSRVSLLSVISAAYLRQWQPSPHKVLSISLLPSPFCPERSQRASLGPVQPDLPPLSQATINPLSAGWIHHPLAPVWQRVKTGMR